jgi:hypothetical protein
MGAPFIQSPALKGGPGIFGPRFAGTGYVVQGRGNGDADNVAPAASKTKSMEDIHK